MAQYACDTLRDIATAYDLIKPIENSEKDLLEQLYNSLSVNIEVSL